MIKFLSQESSEQIAVHCLKVKGYEVQEQQHKSNQLLRNMVSEEEEDEEEEDIHMYYANCPSSLPSIFLLSLSLSLSLSLTCMLSLLNIICLPLDTEA